MLFSGGEEIKDSFIRTVLYAQFYTFSSKHCILLFMSIFMSDFLLSVALLYISDEDIGTLSAFL